MQLVVLLAVDYFPNEKLTAKCETLTKIDHLFLSQPKIFNIFKAEIKYHHNVMLFLAYISL